MSDLLMMVPQWFQRVLEFPEIMKAWEYALDQVDGNIKQLWDNQYIQTCDEPTLALYEKLLGIVPSGTDTLEYRRAVVLNRYAMTVPFTEIFLRQQLDGMFGEDGYTLNIDSSTCSATLEITTYVARARMIFFDLWYGIAPAHIEMDCWENLNTLIDAEQFYGAAVASVVHNSF